MSYAFIIDRITDDKKNKATLLQVILLLNLVIHRISFPRDFLQILQLTTFCPTSKNPGI
jgi:hypothetical protein